MVTTHSIPQNTDTVICCDLSHTNKLERLEECTTHVKEKKEKMIRQCIACDNLTLSKHMEAQTSDAATVFRNIGQNPGHL